MKYVDDFLNGITMYRLILYGLAVITLIVFVLSFLGLISFSPLSLLFSLLTLWFVCFVTNQIFATLLKVQTNIESIWISAFILFLILFPIQSVSDVPIFLLVGFMAMASKYVLVWRKKHIFNPVAISVFVTSLFGFGIASWWVGSSVMLIPTLIFGFLVLRKVSRFELFFAFLGTAFLSLIVFGASNTGFQHMLGMPSRMFFMPIIIITLFSSPVIFLGSIMLTEPLTTPPNKKMQIIYGLIVGGLFGAQFSFGPIYSTPALALVLGNIFSYFVSPRIRLVLTLLEKNKLTADVYEFVWRLDEKISFKAGQYLEWTLGHSNSDSRGNRRFFTIASSPTEPVLRLGIKSYDNSSSFKKKLLSLNVGDKIITSQLSGEFTLPEDKLKKLVFIAGGIGVTPFRSMVKYLIDTENKREATLFFSNRTPRDIVYKDIFDEAKLKLGMKTIYTVNDLAGEAQTEDMRVGFINAEMITKEVPEYKECIYYISGPHGMVTAFKGILSK